MKKTILLTLFALLGITAAIYYFVTNYQGGSAGEFAQRIKEEQSGLKEQRAYQFDMDRRAIVLETAGEKKNVLNFSHNPVYDVGQSNLSRERLDRLINRTDADFQEPIIALNPFGTSENSFYFYFSTAFRCMVRYTITVEDESIQDHVRYVNNGQVGNLSRKHEFLLSGLIPGRTNYILVDLIDSTGSKREGKVYKFTPKDAGVTEKIAVERGYSKEDGETGMFYVFPKDKKQILAYDNQGVIRTIINTQTLNGKRIYQTPNSILYQITDNQVARISSLGRVLGVVTIRGYGNIADFSFDGFDDIYSIGNKKGYCYLLSTSIKTGKTRVVYRFPKEVQISSLSTPQNGGLLLTSVNPSGLIYMDALAGIKPEILCVFGKKSEWKKIVGKKKVVEDKEVVKWNTEKARISSVDETNVSLLVKRDGKATGVCARMDVKKRQLKILSRQMLGGSEANHLQVVGDHMILTDIANGNYAEFDKEGKVTRKFSYGSPVTSVEKLTLEDVCFYGM